MKTNVNETDYLIHFRHTLGYKPDFFPKCDYQKCIEELQSELSLKMPTDTMAREREGHAVFLLVSSKDPEAIHIGKILGDTLMGEYQASKKELLMLIEQAQRQLIRLNQRL